MGCGVFMPYNMLTCAVDYFKEAFSVMLSRGSSVPQIAIRRTTRPLDGRRRVT